MSEKLLSIREVADHLKVSEEEVKRLVDIGEIPAYKIGGTFLRFRREQIEAIKNEIEEVEEMHPELARPVLDDLGKPTHHLTDLEIEIKAREPAARQYDYTFAEKIRDFVYFYDFYVLSFIMIGVLLFMIFKT
ncbi:MAG: helix-turn-helix domain-containing protein [Candidatus Omnitrophica bacterium]|nr:helix-turn-helix domain-containing protein [Candidatus Omnitrophota bacterium]MBU0881092.1 helix-turn-helix domain-containing protein [Candidatus Omnitrophota bacterium]MBU1808860.1 helix-turn-helix domain-containing protein [Candidatus Omnitrophota bacterium]